MLIKHYMSDRVIVIALREEVRRWLNLQVHKESIKFLKL